MARRAALIGGAAGLVAVIAGILGIARDERKTEPEPATAAQQAEAAIANVWPTKVTKDLARGSLAAFVVKPKREAAPDIRFVDEKGATVALSDWRGRVVLVNLWATWCGPCRKEMPALAKLQRDLGSEHFEVVAISVDRKGATAAAAFLMETEATALKLYIDTSAAVMDELQTIGLPATILIDRQGNEIGRLLGPAEWASTEAITLIKAALAEGRS